MALTVLSDGALAGQRDTGQYVSGGMMNPSEQKNHKTRTDALDRRISDVIDATDEHTAALEKELREAISAERTYRLKLADEQRGYVDAADRDLRRCCQERWDATSDAQRRILDQIAALRDRTFWGRLNWMVTGR